MTFARFSIQWCLGLVTPVPALVLGALLMRQNGVPSVIWGQNLIAGLFLMAVCVGLSLLPAPPPNKLRWGMTLTAILSLGLLLATFADAGLSRVHRWVVVGPLRIHVGALCLPALIVVLGGALTHAKGKFTGWLPPLLGVGVMGLLLLQPDAAQASGFAGALVILLFFGRQTIWVRWVIALVTVGCAAWSWMRPDPLLPVPYVEGIVGLAARSGVFWLLASLPSLALLPCPFLLSRKRDGLASPKAFALGLYFALIVIAPCFGQFPVPLLGFGLTPIVGYFVALTWLLNEWSNSIDGTRNGFAHRQSTRPYDLP